ncbi:hypothetical protein [Mycolicibacter senuensis]|uniref:hypothetical protein n=1 Tax=Mycolicibacter senuensis TaxID=386913 RepID=UPI000A25924E|nr:hypothetical protein [Mycolicibacter senuensis]MDQ2629068.1 hypothetical protein [Actinomycetota bacterium]ORW65327.1 hypothetical protein AWC24_16990 [Mycolicibacter senuensis]
MPLVVVVFEQRPDAVAARISSLLIPAATLGHDCASAPTTKSINTGRSARGRLGPGRLKGF